MNTLDRFRHRFFMLLRRLPRGEPSRRSRFFARSGAVALLFGALVHGLVIGGHLDYDGSPWRKLPGKLASSLGFAADDIRITGLVHQEPETLLSAIGVQPGGSLVGFDASRARSLLENLDWVAAARVMRKYPNRLDIVVTERRPFAIWQRDGAHYVIDQTGTAMSTLDPRRLSSLLLITGEGAHRAVADLVSELDTVPKVKARVTAAARVGQRRWTLYMDNGVTVALPEIDSAKALRTLADLDRSQGLLGKGIKSLDLRFPGELVVDLAEPVAPEKDIKNFKVSQKQ
ncbi:cell division protein FtsQ/DivIB [Taklimakanibacter lacteus]|uniref:cell division protein FtsQ/DivIB n=1 Tax=Taklimakanibacter lacteus TaxID=2268456 RepID=UPI000E66A41A